MPGLFDDLCTSRGHRDRLALAVSEPGAHGHCLHLGAAVSVGGMKVPPAARRLARRVLGVGKAPAIEPAELPSLVAREPVVFVAVGVLAPGQIDPALPGEQRAATLGTLARVVADLPRERAIVLHCG